MGSEEVLVLFGMIQTPKWLAGHLTYRDIYYFFFQSSLSHIACQRLSCRGCKDVLFSFPEQLISNSRSCLCLYFAAAFIISYPELDRGGGGVVQKCCYFSECFNSILADMFPIN